MRNAIVVVTSVLLLVLLAGCRAERGTAQTSPPTVLRPEMAERPERDQKSGFQPNLSVTIYADAVNDLLEAIGTVSKTEHVGPKTGLTTYTLEVPPPTVEILADSALLRTNVTVKALGTEYTTEAVGKAEVSYDPDQDMLFLDIGTLLVDIHMKPLGISINIDQLDISNLYQPRIKLLGNLPLATDFKVKKPDQGKEPMQFKITRHQIRYRPGAIVLDLAVDFSPATTTARG